MVKLKRMKSIIACVSVAMLLTGCLSSLVKPESTVTSKVGGGMEELLPPYDGPRAAIAVTDFEWKVGTSKTTIGIGGTDFSFAHEDEVAHTDALKAMLTTALVQSNRFRVIERARVDSIKDEIALQEDGYTNSSGKKRGTLQAPDIQVVAYITGWAPGSSGGGGKIGGALFGKKASALLGAASRGYKKSAMAMDIRIVHVDSGTVLAATSVQTEATDVNFSGALGVLTGGGSLEGGLDSYANTPMEKAIRASILEATRYVAENTPKEYMVY